MQKQAQKPLRQAQSKTNYVHSIKKFPLAVVTQMLTLATNSLGLVAALAWNSAIQEFVNNYIKKWLPSNSGLISLLIYAIIVSLLAILVTYQLSTLKEKFEH